ncbi:MAG: hypothetical protein ACI4S3_01125 [Candidatus Gastranaerophilaceae bacterium]
MSVGAKDRIDKLLVKKYKDKVMNNLDGIDQKMIDPEKMMEAITDVAMVQRNMMVLSNKLSNICSQINAKARYQTGQKFLKGT